VKNTQYAFFQGARPPPRSGTRGKLVLDFGSSPTDAKGSACNDIPMTPDGGVSGPQESKQPQGAKRFESDSRNSRVISNTFTLGSCSRLYLSRYTLRHRSTNRRRPHALTGNTAQSVGQRRTVVASENISEILSPQSPICIDCKCCGTFILTELALMADVVP